MVKCCVPSGRPKCLKMLSNSIFSPSCKYTISKTKRTSLKFSELIFSSIQLKQENLKISLGIYHMVQSEVLFEIYIIFELEKKQTALQGTHGRIFQKMD